MADPLTNDQSASKQLAFLQQRHLIVGWFGLLLFLSLGIALEMMHGFKTGLYLDVQNSSRRLMWTLAHVHGTLFGLIHIAFACSLGLLRLRSPGLLSFASKCLTGAILLMPLGFFFGGLWMYGGDPGLGVLLVPGGAVLLFSGVAMFCLVLLGHRAAEKNRTATDSKKRGDQHKTGESQPRKSSRRKRQK